MGVFLKLENYNELYHSARQAPIILNLLPTLTTRDRERANALTTHVVNGGDHLAEISCCECEHLKGECNVGMICPRCHTEVMRKHDKDLVPLVWVQRPEGVSKMMNPKVLYILHQTFKKGGFNFIEWCMDRHYTPEAKHPPDLTSFMAAWPGRGYNYFIDNFEGIFDTLTNLKIFRAKRRVIRDLGLVILRNPDSVWSDWIPMPNKSLMVIENTGSDTYLDPVYKLVIDAISSVTGMDTEDKGLSAPQKQHRVARMLLTLREAYEQIYYEVLMRKPGELRKHLSGTRANFCLRHVISSNTKQHEYDTIQIPWCGAISVFRTHLVSMLKARGWSDNAALSLLDQSRQRWSKVVDDLLTELFAQTKDGWFWCTFGRNPTLWRGSLGAMRINSWKKDPADQTITMSILAVRSFNADRTYS